MSRNNSYARVSLLVLVSASLLVLVNMSHTENFVSRRYSVKLNATSTLKHLNFLILKTIFFNEMWSNENTHIFTPCS